MDWPRKCPDIGDDLATFKFESRTSKVVRHLCTDTVRLNFMTLWPAKRSVTLTRFTLDTSFLGPEV